jgi:hypothetical protein
MLAVCLCAIDLATAGAASPRRQLLGCWSQTSPFPARAIPPDRTEWGSRTWCFRPRGRLESWNMACGRDGGCDGWDRRWRYRWRGARLELLDFSYDAQGTQRQIWRRCRPVVGKDQFVLTNCGLSEDPFVRDSDPKTK